MSAQQHSPKQQDLGGLGLAAAVLIVWVLGCGLPQPPGGKSGSNPAPAGASNQVAQTPSKASNWVYNEDADEMGRGQIKWARTTSVNTVNFDFPYSGEQNARLTLRTHPQHGKDVMLSVERGQFLCRFDGCSVLVRFDEGKPTAFSAAEPADHSTTMLFLSGYDKFVANLRRSKKVRIEAPFYQQGNQIFEFDVEGLEWETKPPAKASGR